VRCGVAAHRSSSVTGSVVATLREPLRGLSESRVDTEHTFSTLTSAASSTSGTWSRWARSSLTRSSSTVGGVSVIASASFIANGSSGSNSSGHTNAGPARAGRAVPDLSPCVRMTTTL
jgi:hypothetical protein